jgi:hypothetical protein
MKLLRQGTWWIHSKIDKRWNINGRCMCGGFMKPEEVDRAIEKFRKIYGNPPSDLNWGYMKD